MVVDVETSGFDPATSRILSVAALTLTRDGTVEHTLHTLLNPGVDPGPTNVHGLTAVMLAGQPRYADIADDLAPLLRGRPSSPTTPPLTTRFSQPKPAAPTPHCPSRR